LLLTLVQCNSFVPFHIGFLRFLSLLFSLHAEIVHMRVMVLLLLPLLAQLQKVMLLGLLLLLMPRRAMLQAQHATNHALGPTVVHDASQIAHPVVRAAARAAISHIATQTAAAIHHAVNQTVALTTICHAANRTTAHVVNRTELLHGPRHVLIAGA
jgi:hypothetical protein